MVRLPKSIRQLLSAYVPVRVTDMRTVDLAFYDFDFDLTFAALLMNADGTIYHTFAGRDFESAEAQLSMGALAAVLRETLEEHAEHELRPRSHTPQTIGDSPTFQRWVQEGRKLECVHCHNIADVRTQDAQQEGTFRQELLWRWPDPIQVGLRIAEHSQRTVADVERGSPAEAIGLRAGDRLIRVGERRILTFGDLQRSLHEFSEEGGALGVEFARGNEVHSAMLSLSPNWKAADPRVFAWRPSKWAVSPKPGFGGPPLGAEKKRALGIPEDRFAFRVQYLVTWGESAHTGRNAAAAGLRQGDIVLSVGGKDDFDSVDHFHAWFRLTRKVGEHVAVVVLRDGERRQLRLKVIE